MSSTCIQENRFSVYVNVGKDTEQQVDDSAILQMQLGLCIPKGACQAAGFGGHADGLCCFSLCSTFVQCCANHRQTLPGLRTAPATSSLRRPIAALDCIAFRQLLNNPITWQTMTCFFLRDNTIGLFKAPEKGRLVSNAHVVTLVVLRGESCRC